MPTVEPIDAIVALLEAQWQYSVWKFDIVSRDNSNKPTIIKQEEYYTYKPTTKTYLVVTVPGDSTGEYYGHWSHHIDRHPVDIEVHGEDVASRPNVIAGKNEILRIADDAALDPSKLGSDYRKLRFLNRGINIGSHQNPKFMVKVQLEEQLLAL